MTDEEVLERAFLSALQKHFKKPGPWLIMKHPDTNIRDPFHCPAGEVWEVYFGLDGSNTLAEMEVDLKYTTGGSNIIVWCQNASFAELIFCPFRVAVQAPKYFAFDNIDPVSGNVEWLSSQVDGAANIIDDPTVASSAMMEPEGYIIHSWMNFQSSAVGVGSKGFFVLYRRRYDLET